MASGWTDPRPMSPHLQVWRWHVTMASSIFHRASGIANFVGMIVLTAWLGAIAGGPDVYAAFEGFMLSWFGRLVLFGFTVSIAYHLLNGARHLIWDAGAGLDPKTASTTGWLAIIGAPILAAGIWFAAYTL